MLTGSDDQVRSALADIAGVEVRSARLLTGGASRQTWRCETSDGVLIAQRQRAGAVHDMALEAQVLAAAAAEGVPVPGLVGHRVDADGVSTLVTRLVDGETIARKILRDDGYARARAVLAEQLGRALARIHRIAIDRVPGLPVVDPLATSRQHLDAIGEPHPAFELAFRWLDEHRPAPLGPPVVVHGDFRLGNVIVDANGMAASIDWELAHIGDRGEDLGWLCVPAWRFGSDLPVAGVAGRQVLLDAYADESGVVVDRETLRWWEVGGILRWGIICVMQAETHRSGTVRSHELAAIGRRVCENEHDLFLALEGRW
jgi:aminoglycoside phosphotransferase (APT) family kinase protein